MKGTSSLAVVVALASVSTPEAASSSETSCLLKVDGIVYDATPCDRGFEDGHVIQFGGSVASGGYWVDIPKGSDGRYPNVRWNGPAGGNQAEYLLGDMQRDGDCWSNDTARLCRNINPEEPLYYIDGSKPGPLDDMLRAFWQGQEYIIERPEWDVVFPVALGPQADFDGDGRLDQIVETSLGGNGSPGYLSIVSFHGDGFFTFLNDEEISSGWEGYEVLSLNGRTTLRVKQDSTGVGNTAEERYHEDWAVVDGAFVKLIERQNYSRREFIVSLTAEGLRQHPGQAASINYDVDLDGVADEISCSYWERWGTMKCSIKLSKSRGLKRVSCKRIGVSKVVSAYGYTVDCNGNAK